MRTRFNSSWPLASPEISPELLSSALQGIHPSAECCGLPYVALLVPNPAHVNWIHGLHSLMYAFAVSPLVWTKQSLYHSFEPGRPPNSFMSYRVLGQSTAQRRLQEELFVQFEPDLWRHTGKFQEGRQECQIVVAADVASVWVYASMTARKLLTLSGDLPCLSTWLLVFRAWVHGAWPMNYYTPLL